MIESIAIHLPQTELTNEELAAVYTDWSAEKIFQKTGIRKRHIVREGELSSDLAFEAAEKLLKHYDRKLVDFLLFCTQSPDYFLPTTACCLQHRLCLSTECGAFDFNLGCSGYVYGLATCQSLVQTGLANKVLFLTGETYSRFLGPLDRSTRTIFGDAGSATMISGASPNRLHSFVFGTDGRGFRDLIVQKGGMRYPFMSYPTTNTEVSTGAPPPQYLYMNGPEIFNFTVQTVPTLVRAVLRKANLSIDDVDYYIFHQANRYMLEHLRKKVGIPENKFEISLENCGNTVSSTIPIALNSAIEAGRVRAGMKLMLVGFGVGLSWAGCIFECNHFNKNKA